MDTETLETLAKEAKNKKSLMQNLDIQELIDMRPYETEDEGTVWALRYYDSDRRRCTTFFRRA
jgi:hypothetical protein